MPYRYSHIFLISFSILLLSCSTTDKTKTAPEVSRENVKVVTETKPVIIGGIDALYQRLTYPSKNSRQTSTITLKANILVNKDGTVGQVSFNKDQYSKYKEAAREAIHAVNFVPGKRNGEAVNMFITIPFQFNAQ